MPSTESRRVLSGTLSEEVSTKITVSLLPLNSPNASSSDESEDEEASPMESASEKELLSSLMLYKSFLVPSGRVSFTSTGRLDFCSTGSGLEGAAVGSSASGCGTCSPFLDSGELHTKCITFFFL